MGPSPILGSVIHNTVSLLAQCKRFNGGENGHELKTLRVVRPLLQYKIKAPVHYNAETAQIENTCYNSRYRE